ncbi:MAG: ACT domain-containing protein [Candidatus Acidiferrum sp.]
MRHQLTIRVHAERFGICRLKPDEQIPAWAQASKFLTVSRTPAELSIVCEETLIPEEIAAERRRRLLQVEGILPFSLTGVLAAIAGPLAEAHVSIFALSTYDTDYMLVSSTDLERAIQVLEAAGHAIRRGTAS